MLCGFSIAEYIRCRRLALAGSELVSTDKKIIDIALKYGYDSPDSFTRSFTRFHGVTPTAVRKSGGIYRGRMVTGDVLCCKYGINIDESMSGNVFEYLIADDDTPALETVEGIVTRVIPAFTWAVFACRGALPQSMQDVNQIIFSEWLPNCRDYEIAAGYNIEKYSDPAQY